MTITNNILNNGVLNDVLFTDSGFPIFKIYFNENDKEKMTKEVLEYTDTEVHPLALPVGAGAALISGVISLILHSSI